MGAWLGMGGMHGNEGHGKIQKREKADLRIIPWRILGSLARQILVGAGHLPDL